MAVLKLSARGAAPVDEAWLRYADTRAWARWAPHLAEVRTDGAPHLREGLRGTVRSFAGPRVPFEVTAVDDQARTWNFVVRLGPLRLRFEHGVEPCDRGSRATLRALGPYALLLPYAPIAYLALRRLVA